MHVRDAPGETRDDPSITIRVKTRRTDRSDAWLSTMREMNMACTTPVESSTNRLRLSVHFDIRRGEAFYGHHKLDQSAGAHTCTCLRDLRHSICLHYLTHGVTFSMFEYLQATEHFVVNNNRPDPDFSACRGYPYLTYGVLGAEEELRNRH